MKQEGKGGVSATMLVGRKLTGRCANGGEADAGRLAHATTCRSYSHGKALCGAKPGRLSAGWGDATYQVTCSRCLRRMGGAQALSTTELEALRLIRDEGHADRLFDRPGGAPEAAGREAEAALNALESRGLIVIERDGDEAIGMALTEVGRAALVGAS